MAHTDKTKPLKFRMLEPGFAWRETSNLESLVGMGRGHTKFYKRLEHKRNRRRKIPHTAYRGYGWGDANYKYAFSD